MTSQHATFGIIDALTDRLRGNYRVGPHLPNGEPEFGWRQFEAPPIQHEAAQRIEELEQCLRDDTEILNNILQLEATRHSAENRVFGLPWPGTDEGHAEYSRLVDARIAACRALMTALTEARVKRGITEND